MSGHVPSPVDPEHLARDERGLRRDEKSDGLRDVFGAAETTQRNAVGRRPRANLGDGLRLHHRSTRTDDVDPYCRRRLDGQYPAEGFDPTLAGPVGGESVAGNVRFRRGRVDDARCREMRISGSAALQQKKRPVRFVEITLSHSSSDIEAIGALG